MSDTKISSLPSGAPAQLTDVLPISRSGSSYSLSVNDVLAPIKTKYYVFTSNGVYTPSPTVVSATITCLGGGGGGGYGGSYPMTTGTVATLASWTTAIITTTAPHGLLRGQKIAFSGSPIPSGIIAGNDYWVAGTNFGTSTFSVTSTISSAVYSSPAITIGTASATGGGTVSSASGYGGTAGQNATASTISVPASILLAQPSYAITVGQGGAGGTPTSFFATSSAVIPQTVTFVNASNVVTITGITALIEYQNLPIQLTTTGILPTGFSTNTTYYIVALSTTTYGLAPAPNGTAITAGSAGSGTHYPVYFGVGQQGGTTSVGTLYYGQGGGYGCQGYLGGTTFVGTGNTLNPSNSTPNSSYPTYAGLAFNAGGVWGINNPQNGQSPAVITTNLYGSVSSPVVAAGVAPGGAGNTGWFDGNFFFSPYTNIGTNPGYATTYNRGPGSSGAGSTTSNGGVGGTGAYGCGGGGGGAGDSVGGYLGGNGGAGGNGYVLIVEYYT
jgi:hypothetical protein